MKRLLPLIGIVTLAIALISVGYIAATQRHAVRFDGFKLIQASQAFTRQLREQGKPVPATVSSTELVQRGFLTPADLGGFGDAELIINLNPDETRPQSVLVQARLPDGHEFVVLGDGSVQQRH